MSVKYVHLNACIKVKPCQTTHKIHEKCLSYFLRPFGIIKQIIAYIKMKDHSEYNLPPIPKIRDQELRHAVSSLAHSGNYYRQAFLQVLQGKLPQDVLMEQLEYLKAADAIIEKWLIEFKDIDFDIPENDVDPEKN